jgi:hypothetical protein
MTNQPKDNQRKVYGNETKINGKIVDLSESEPKDLKPLEGESDIDIEYDKLSSWFDSQETRFHQGQFDDKSIAYAAYIFAKQEVERAVREKDAELARKFIQFKNQAETIRNYQNVTSKHFPDIYACSENLDEELTRVMDLLKQEGLG